MLRSIVCFTVSTFFLATMVPQSFADQGILLTDEQLDDVHAGGLFLDFDRSFGDINNVGAGSNNTSTNPQPISNNSAVVNSNPDVQYVTIGNSSNNSGTSNNTTQQNNWYKPKPKSTSEPKTEPYQTFTPKKYTLITARYVGWCQSCCGETNAGEAIAWVQRYGATHWGCRKFWSDGVRRSKDGSPW